MLRKKQSAEEAQLPFGIRSLLRKKQSAEQSRLPLGIRSVLGDASDRRLERICAGGAACAAAATLLDGAVLPLPGVLALVPALCLLACHVLYGSLLVAGGQWFQLQWDALLRETALFAAIFALPLAAWQVPARWLLLLLLFRLMVGSFVSGEFEVGTQRLASVSWVHITE